MRRGIIIIVSFFLLFFIFNQVVHADTIKSNLKRKHVLILNSFEEGNRWRDSLVKSIKNGLYSYDEKIDINIENMDVGEADSKEYFEILKNLYQYKYKSKKFDVIISTDSEAFNFLRTYGNYVFKDVPVVFCGVNNFNKDMIESSNLFTGITENINIEGTLKLALNFSPKAEKVGVVVGKSSDCGHIKSSIESLEPEFSDKVQFTFIEEDDIKRAIKEIKKLPKNSILIMAADFKDSDGQNISKEESCKIISENCKLPIYTTWDFYVESGALGGNVTRGYDYGREAAKLAIRVLKGEKPDKIPIERKDFSSYLFNYEQLKRFNISLFSLPFGSKLVNGPFSGYRIPRKAVFVFTLSVFIILTVIIIILLVNSCRRKRAEGALRESEERLRTLIEASPDIVCFKDGKGRWLEANKAMIETHQMEGVDYKGLTNRELASKIKSMCEEFRHGILSDEECWIEKKIKREEKKIKDREGKELIFDIIKIPLFNCDNSRKGLIILGRKVTEEILMRELKKEAENKNKQINDLVEYDKLKTEFFANISHELRTPLNVILGALQLTQLIFNSDNLYEKKEKVIEYSYIMKQNCYRLVRIVNNLIDITKIDAGFFQLEMKNYDIISIVEDITLSVSKYIESKGLEVIFDTDIEEKVIACDPDLIERIMLNLLSNAIKFTQSGGKIMVDIKDKEENIQIRVKDTGIGIPKEKQKEIFERFVQVDKSLSRNREGSGIGLSLVKSLVELHGGKIRVESEYNYGSEFIIDLPVTTLDNAEVKNPHIEQSNIEKINIEFSDIYS